MLIEDRFDADVVVKCLDIDRFDALVLETTPETVFEGVEIAGTV